jgi:signal transduction histidine kinase
MNFLVRCQKAADSPAQLIALINDECNEEKRRLSQVLSYISNLENLIFPEAPTVFVLGDLVGEFVEEFRSLYGIDFEYSNHSQAEILVFGRQQVLWFSLDELAYNAYKHAKRNGRISLVLSLISPAMARLEISDNGPGVRPEIHSRIFDKNFSEGDGTGYGLWRVAHVINHDFSGSISEDGKFGSGARFLIDIPVYYDKELIL